MGIAIDMRSSLTGDEDIERVRQARRKLRQVREVLMTPSPEQLGECGPVLEEAADLLGSLLDLGMSSARGPVLRRELRVELRRELGDELQDLRRELTVVTALMQQAAGYYLGWAEMLSAAISGYTSQGEVPLLEVESRLSVEG